MLFYNLEVLRNFTTKIGITNGKVSLIINQFPQ